MLIKSDAITHALTILAVLISVYLATFDLGLLLLFPAILLICGIALQTYLIGHTKEKMFHEEVNYGRNFIYVMAALLVMAVCGLMVENLFIITRALATISGYNLLLHATLMAIAEEQFFRGAVSNYLFSVSHSTLVAVIGGATIFSVYHLAMYASNIEALVYVMMAGVSLEVSAFETRALSTPMLAHVINNFLAVVMGGFV